MDSFLVALSSGEKVAVLRMNNRDQASLARHTLKNQGPVTELSFNSFGQLLLISSEEVSSHFRKIHVNSLIWENYPREEMSEAIAGFWSESGLAISSFIPKAFESQRESSQYSANKTQASRLSRGNLYELENREKLNQEINLEIPLQNVNHWKNNSRGINFIFADNKLIVFKVKD